MPVVEVWKGDHIILLFEDASVLQGTAVVIRRRYFEISDFDLNFFPYVCVNVGVDAVTLEQRPSVVDRREVVTNLHPRVRKCRHKIAHRVIFFLFQLILGLL